jgi:hypothetical protein
MAQPNREDLILYALGEVEAAPLPLPAEKPAEVSTEQSAPVPHTPRVFPAECCQQCGAEVREVGGGFRCPICAWQPRIVNPGSANRKQIEDPEWQLENKGRGTVTR